MRAVLFLLIFLTGCLTPISKIEYEKDGKIEVVSVQGFLKETFTDEAYEAIKDIEVYESPSKTFGVALCTSKWSYILSLFCGAGFDRSILIIDTSDTRSHIVHEMVHHLDDIGRDGGKQFIEPDKFIRAYARSRKYKSYSYIVRYSESESLFHFVITELFGIGIHSERIANCADLIWNRWDVPDSLKEVYRKVFRKYETHPD